MTREELLEDLRELYSKNEMNEFKRKFCLGRFMLTNEDIKKIEATTGISREKKLTKEQKRVFGIILKHFPGSRII